jgi:hypothetical protein
MNCRAATNTLARPQAPTARERLEKIDRLSEWPLDAIERKAAPAELSIRALEIQGIACIGAAYERRRERGETFELKENFNAR